MKNANIAIMEICAIALLLLCLGIMIGLASYLGQGK
jgi:uncharacterized membrane protein (DUF373 family)